MSETSKYRHLTKPYCYNEDGTPLAVLDVASQGDPVVPWAFQLDLPPDEFEKYSNGQRPVGIQLAGYASVLPIASESVDVLYSSHFIEDVYDWTPLLKEWTRVVKKNGKII